MATRQETTYTYTCDLCGEEKNKEELTAVQFRKGHPPVREGRPHEVVPQVRPRDPGATPGRPPEDRLAGGNRLLLRQPGYGTGPFPDPPVIDICQQCASRPISVLLAYNGSPVAENDSRDAPDAEPPG